MNYMPHVALAAAIAAALPAGILSAQAADSASEAELRRLVAQQSEQLRQQSEQLLQQSERLRLLGERLAVLEGQSGPSLTVDPVQAQLDAAIADTRQDDLAILQGQVAQLAATGGGGGNTRWQRGGPQFRSDDGFFTMSPRARIMADFSSTRGSNFDARNINGTEMRAARLGAMGSIGDFGYKIDVDFADDAVSVKDAYLSYDTRIGYLPAEIYVGNKLKDRSIDGSTSLPRTPFMERNAVASVGSPAAGYFGLGAQLKLIGSNWHASVAIAGDDLDNTGDNTDTVVYNARAHWNPVKRGSGFVHLGGWYFHEELGADVTSINKTPRIALDFNDNVRVSASSIANVTDDHAYGVEVGGVYRNFWAFGEYTERTINSSTVDSVDHKATSVYAGWLITGEKPGFSARSGVWGRTRVLRPVGSGGFGAFELAARYDEYDFTDAARGGKGDSWTLGLNWYFNDWTRMMFNYVRWTTDNQVGSYRGKDEGNTFAVRTQIAF